MELSLRAALVFLALAPAAAPQISAVQRGRRDLPPHTRFQAYNRYTVQGVGDVGLGAAGVFFRLNDPDAVASYRFTSPAPRTATAVWLHYRTEGSPTSVRVSLVEDGGDGLPTPGAPASTAVFTPQPAAAQPSWHRIPLGAATADLLPGRVYHVVIEPVAGAGPSDYVDLTGSRARHPIQFFPADATGATPMQPPYDEAFALLYDDDRTSGYPLVVQRRVAKAYLPIFLLECGAEPALGQPLDVHHEESVDGLDWYGQAIELTSTLSVDYVAMLVRGWGFTSDPLPDGDLFIHVLRDDNGVVTQLASALLAQRTDTLYRGRSHWFGAHLPQLVTLEPGPGVRHYVAVSSPASLPGRGYVYSAESSTLPLPASVLPTYMYDRSYAVRSSDGGASFQVYSGVADAGFLLGRTGTALPIAVVDEFTGMTRCPLEAFHYPWVARAGSPIQFKLTNRNVGATSASGEVYAQLVRRDTGAIVSELLNTGIQRNTESQILQQGTLDFTMDVADMFLLLECGRVENGVKVPTDVLPVEVRLDPTCP